MAVEVKKEKNQADVIHVMTKRVDRLMKAVQNEIKDEGLRFELVTDLVAVRRKLAERNGDDE